MARNTFIRVIEYWLPSVDGSLLEFGGGLFGGATRFEAATERLCFGRGEGLPGQVWEQGRPIVLKDLSNTHFRRSAAAQAEGLSCGIALWANQPADSADLTLVDGYYGTTGDTFEFISRATAFRRGTGLPGMAWEQERPVFLPDLGKGSGFLRVDGAIKVGINRGFAIPGSSTDGAHYVIAFLSALATPIARGVSIWEAGADGVPQRRFGFDEAKGLLEGTATDSDGPVAKAFASGQPAVAGASIAIPVAPQGRLRTVMVLDF